MLIDSNVFIEVGRAQEKQDVCKDLLRAIDDESLCEDSYITDYTLHALECMLYKRSKPFLEQVLLMIHEGKIKIFRSSAKRDLSTLSILKDIELDFDDGVQFMATNSLRTYLVTYDKHFKKTHLPIKTPDEVLKDILI